MTAVTVAGMLRTDSARLRAVTTTSPTEVAAPCADAAEAPGGRLDGAVAAGVVAAGPVAAGSVETEGADPCAAAWPKEVANRLDAAKTPNRTRRSTVALPPKKALLRRR